MSKIAREISKKVSVVALATALAVQAVPVNAVELEEKNDAQVVETTEEKAEAAETKVEEAAPVVEKEESIKESPKDTSRYNNYYDDNNDDDEIINIPDKVLEYNIIHNSNVGFDKDYVTKGDMKNIQTLFVKGHITSLEGLQYAEQLDGLTIDDVTGADLTALNSIKSLRVLDIYKGAVDLRYVGGLGVIELNLAEVSNENLDDIKNMWLLTLIIKNAPNMKDISGIKNMDELSKLKITGTESKRSPLTDVSVLKYLPELQQLDLSYTSVSDLDSFIKDGGYDYLKLYNCNISDISKLAEFKDYKIEALGLNGNNISDPTAIFERNSKFVRAENQTATLPEIVTEAGDVTYKIPYGEYVTDVEIDENVGKYNPETKEITFFNVTSSKNVTYKVIAQKEADTTYYYDAAITQPIKVTNPIAEPETEVPAVSGNNTKATTTINKVSEESPKTGDAGAVGVLSLAFVSLAGAVKSRKRK